MGLRRMLARLGVLVLLCSGLVLGPSATAFACSCATGPLSDSIEASDGIFVGTTGDLVDGLDVTWNVEVHRVYKGDVATEVTVSTGQEGPNGMGNSCNYDLVPGRRVVFFASGTGTEWSSSLCSVRYEPTGQTMRQLETRIGPSTEPDAMAKGKVATAEEAATDPSWGVWAGAGAGALAGVIALVLWRSRRAS